MDGTWKTMETVAAKDLSFIVNSVDTSKSKTTGKKPYEVVLDSSFFGKKKS